MKYRKYSIEWVEHKEKQLKLIIKILEYALPIIISIIVSSGLTLWLLR